jgi:HK97 family phage major capsid protein
MGIVYKRGLKMEIRNSGYIESITSDGEEIQIDSGIMARIRSMDPYTQIEILRTQRRGLMNRLESLSSRSLTPEEQAGFDALVAHINELDARVATIEAEVMADPANDPGDAPTPKRSVQKQVRTPVPNIQNRWRRDRVSKNAIRSWLRLGTSVEERQDIEIAKNAGALSSNAFEIETRMDTGASPGSNTVAKGFVAEYEKQLKYYAPWLNLCRVINSRNGEPLRLPVDKDQYGAYATGSWISELTADTEKEPTMAEVTFGAYTISSGLVSVSWELLQDASINIDQLLADQLAARIGRTLDAAVTTGTGSGQPTGFLTNAGSTGIPSGNVLTGSSASALTLDDLVNAINLLDKAYQSRTGVAWAMNAATLTALRKLKDSQSRYLVNDAVNGAAPTLFGYPVVIAPGMANIGTGNKSVVLADWSKYVIRQVQGTTLKKSADYLFNKRATCFVALARYDANWADPRAGVAIAHP